MAKRTYFVSGVRPYRGNKPGSTFEADLPDDVRERAIARGSISEGSAPKKVKESLEAKPREELDAMARSLGVNTPEKLENKAAVVSAIRSYDKE